MESLAPKYTDIKPTPKLKTVAEVVKAYKVGTLEFYQAAYLILQFDKGFESNVHSCAQRILNHMDLYESFEKATGVPWIVPALILAMECGSNPLGCLHNGELIIGTNRKTTLVPKGRGPFKTWLEAALDAVKVNPEWKSISVWDVASILWFLERWNGTGYILYHPDYPSPYDFAETNIGRDFGKYTGDGKWDAKANANGQVGAAALMLELEKMGKYRPKYRVF